MADDPAPQLGDLSFQQVRQPLGGHLAVVPDPDRQQAFGQPGEHVVDGSMGMRSDQNATWLPFPRPAKCASARDLAYRPGLASARWPLHEHQVADPDGLTEGPKLVVIKALRRLI